MFLRFLTIFRSCCRNPNDTFAGGPSKEFSEIAHTPLVYINHPGKIEITAMSSQPARGRPPAAVRSSEFAGDGPYGRLAPAGADLGSRTDLGTERPALAVQGALGPRCDTLQAGASAVGRPGDDVAGSGKSKETSGGRRKVGRRWMGGLARGGGLAARVCDWRTKAENNRLWLGFGWPVARARRGRGDGQLLGTLGWPSGCGCMRSRGWHGHRAARGFDRGRPMPRRGVR
jgi:hypothetical protein